MRFIYRSPSNGEPTSTGANMSVLSISVTEFSRGLSDFLNQVQYRGQVLSIERGKRTIAQVLPPAPSTGFAINKLDAFLTGGPTLDGAEAEAMSKDTRALRTQMRPRSDPWAS